MDKYNWTEVFPDTPKHFHEKVEEALLQLPEEKERCNMENTRRKMSLKKVVLIALAAVMVLGTTVFAAGRIASISGHSSSIPDYTKLPDAEQVKAVLGVEAKLVDTFANGYQFKSGHIGKNQAKAENGEVIRNYQDLALFYKNGKQEASVYMNPALGRTESEPGSPMDISGDIPLYYDTYANKCVAGDYVLTEQDKADIESGKYVFSYGIEKDEPIQVQHVYWTEQGVDYEILAMDSELTGEDLIGMAKEIIQAE